MPNAALIEQLFGLSSSSPRTDLLIIDGGSPTFSIDNEIKKLNDILKHNHPFPNLYIVNVDEATFNNYLKPHYEKGNFSVLGLEKLSKATVRKIMSSLPASVTKIGVVNLASPVAAEYFASKLDLPRFKDVEVVYGDASKDGLKKVFLPMNVSIANKKRKRKPALQPQLSIEAPVMANASTDTIMQLYNENAHLRKINGKLTEAIEKDPKAKKVSEYQAKLAEAEEKFASVTAYNVTLLAENARQINHIAQLESDNSALSAAAATVAFGTPKSEAKSQAPSMYADPVPFLTYPRDTEIQFSLPITAAPNEEQLKEAHEILLDTSSSSSVMSIPFSPQQQQQVSPHVSYSIFSPPKSPEPRLLSRFPPPPRYEEPGSNLVSMFMRS